MQSPVAAYLANLHERLSALAQGQVATYIPELAKVDPGSFAVAIVTMDGAAYCVGDSDVRFTLQSMSKPFVYATALGDGGCQFVGSKVGVEPSGDAFNSISLDPQTGAPLNPMINAGAIASTSLVAGRDAGEQWTRVARSIAMFAGRPVEVDEAVYRSESGSGFRNRAIGWMLKNFGVIDGDPMEVLENYFRQCSLLVDCKDLAYMAATLANGGIHPLTGEIAMPTEHVERVLSVMATCGMYNYAGSWMYEVGMPAKSGVSGGIIAVVPGRFGIGVFSPRLDEKGNSVRGIAACRELSRDFGLNLFTRTTSPWIALGRVYTAAVAPSRRQHALEVRTQLAARAHGIKYLCLHGYLAVDGAEYVIRRMQSLAPDTRAFILDMHETIGITDGAARLLNQARLGFVDEGIAVVCSRVGNRRALLGPLSKSVRKGDRGFLAFEDNDLAVEWCENRLLEEVAAPPAIHGGMMQSILFRNVPAHLLCRVESVATRARYGRGERILEFGQEGDGRVFFIESGHVSVLVPLQNGAHQRIASLGPGMEFGEMALVGQTTRSAVVHADTDVQCSVLHAAEFGKVAATAPELRVTVLTNLATDLANRLRGANQWIAALA